MEKMALDEINRPLGMSFSLPRNSTQVLCSEGDNDFSSSHSATWTTLTIC